MPDTLTPIHEDLDNALLGITALINFDATVAEDHLDQLVRAGAERQRRRQHRFDNPGWYALQDMFTRHLLDGYRSHAEQLKLFERFKNQPVKDGVVTFPMKQRAGEPGDLIVYKRGISTHLNEPWHYEYPSVKPRSWWRRLRDRLGL